ncbi:MAG: 50S ribosomal protein L5 [Pigeon pea little leaf phytoplasma]|uniref:Large ribosomal subunit protein uL5 n=1 Tax=Candidatus Phytoplasma fabacearum TaxID=2982628 RepID=A0ABU8ZSU3_9MOLU|nr:50S ribosomal protein L5 ['Bituminaria bituminosa' little leaf phytoplasma]MDV3148928.1 50S ribosomal protein L5 [Pigeon pea little leaf phytoplasma]MDO7983415.1 50S ribosomal protein L5 ['Bituminaria bituminosa' little leaf phytoplasma]MDO8023850.1 50S ribosomal protein L5 ['Bituminaria bituminosa' little leaf phytoplasma]MDO8030596.1 50S ribosomal protein L5 ['Bituminaria bituminosa' little leaf phytoplasma]MDV3153916.1 50S ribosomal protein L5 [Pigeon pea little leaf phytoplasma]
MEINENNNYTKNDTFLALKEIFNVNSIMQVPKIEKIVINVGLGKSASDTKFLDDCRQQLALISGQIPINTEAKKSISNFKLRTKEIIGLKVTLRGHRKEFFLNKLIHIVLTRIKDFSGLSLKSFDGKGNYNLGIKEQIIFPEISLDQVKRNFGMDISIVTTASNDQQAKKLLDFYGMPFKRTK